MAALGQLAAGAAHEINNPIGFIYSNLNTFQQYLDRIKRLLRLYDQLGEDPAVRAAAQDALRRIAAQKREMEYGFLLRDSSGLITDCLEGASRVVDIVQNLKEFSYVDQARKQWSNVNTGIESTLKLIRNEFKYKASVQLELGQVPDIECFPQQLNQVFLNLLVNAAQAIEKEGHITIRTRAEDGTVVVQIQDDGCGISPENLPHIFEPFFSTKPVSMGTGLGRSLVYNIVQQHQGEIQVESQVGRGAMFTVRLPTQPKAVPAQPAMP